MHAFNVGKVGTYNISKELLCLCYEPTYSTSMYWMDGMAVMLLLAI